METINITMDVGFVLNCEKTISLFRKLGHETKINQ